MRRPFDLSLYLVLDRGLCAGIGMVETAQRAVAGGVTTVQLRDKSADTARMIDTGRALKAALAGTGAALIINDDVAAAVEIGADGLHIGQGDMPVTRARDLIGEAMILGLSVETPELAGAVDPDRVDYIGAGPVFATPSKLDHERPVGFDGLAAQIAASPVPAVAIGGLKAAHVEPVFAAGAQGVAVVSAICGQPDPHAAARHLRRAIDTARRG
ncbi:thiamine phosphate synthase [Roseospira marina]|uniref:Thiamine-phosphate synthase n=1 Tax=Roseospira marina TaxID=140057 RepID=A0A5M6I7L2_9PROT|nr:thiamine phosphate synthase [Roseospira marina]KAA5604122.1 thiamine phosphate synthase [Roseospira marina]MBB4315774.1 thiamine-phosphate pyrophosphorylase [Roseospira marina]MBB5088987.1 thiamine-phosphate pyrophosphorylase [Roseospira marina]